MTVKRRVLLYGLAPAVLCSTFLIGSGLAACPEPCQNCSADPAFIQADMRRPYLVHVVREALAKKEKLVETETLLVIIHTDQHSDEPGNESCCSK